MAQRIGPSMVFRDRQGIRDAVRLGAVQALGKAEEADTTVLLMPGRKRAVVGESLETGLPSFI